MLGWFEIGGNIMIVIIVLAIVIFRIISRFLHHKEQMAAIEKGINLPNVKATVPISIISISAGLGMTIIAILLAAIMLFQDSVSDRSMVMASGIFAVGVALLVYGILCKQYNKSKTSELK